ncbi:S8 family serine peptidase [Bacillus sp. FSL H8-0547]
MKKWFLLAILSAVAACAYPAEAEAGSVLISVNDDMKWENFRTPDGLSPGTDVKPLPGAGLVRVSSSDKGNLEKTVKKIEQQLEPYILESGSDPEMKLPDIPKDSFISWPVISSALLYKNWGWDVKAVTEGGKSYELHRGSRNVEIAVVDTGIDLEHPDLKESIVRPGQSFVPNSPSTDDNNGHGTMTAGMISANGELLGVGPGLGIVPYKVMDKDAGQFSWMIEGVLAAIRDRADVIQISLGTYKSLSDKDERIAVRAFEKAAGLARRNGILIVASAGNEGIDLSNPGRAGEQLGRPGERMVHLPGGSLKNTVSVSAATRQNQLAPYSNYGKEIDFTAPGGVLDYTDQTLAPLILTTYPIDLPQPVIPFYLGMPKGYEFSAGTSLAAPKTAATAGLIISAYLEKHGKKPSADKVLDIMRRSANDLGMPGSDPQFGSGMINAFQALKLAAEEK